MDQTIYFLRWDGFQCLRNKSSQRIHNESHNTKETLNLLYNREVLRIVMPSSRPCLFSTASQRQIYARCRDPAESPCGLSVVKDESLQRDVDEIREEPARKNVNNELLSVTKAPKANGRTVSGISDCRTRALFRRPLPPSLLTLRRIIKLRSLNIEILKGWSC